MFTNRTRGTLLVDLDEVLFPFAQGYNDWMWRKHGFFLNQRYLHEYKISKAAGSNHKDLKNDFLNDVHTIYKQKPVLAAAQALSDLQGEYRIVICTERNHDLTYDSTMSWLENHTPFIREIFFSNDITEKQFKQNLAKEVDAVALIDDKSKNLKKLPQTCVGFLVEREYPTLSEPNALPWANIYTTLKNY